MTAMLNRHPRRILTGLAAAILIAAIIAAGAVASADGAAAAQAQKPTIVLVHGGWADSSGWNKQVTQLQRLGYPVIAPANPLRGLSSDAAYIRSLLLTIKTPIVLVGHSYGGAVISNAAVGVPNVKALVYIAGFAPDKGESLLKLVTMNPGSQIGPKTLITRKYPIGDGGEGIDLYLTRHGFRTAFAGDLPTKLADQMWAEQRPFSEEAFASSSDEPGWKTIRSWYLVATEDRAIPPATQRFMANRAKAEITQEKASHVPMISKPASTTNLIVKVANSVASVN